jgi:transcriptional regulator with XRE-family HTH domain
MTRIERLRSLKGWTQPEMAAFLGLHQSQVSRMETGKQDESGPVSRLLDQLETELASQHGEGARDEAPPTQPEEASPDGAEASSGTKG